MICILLREPLPSEKQLKEELQIGLDCHLTGDRLRDCNYNYWRRTANKKFKTLIDVV